MTLNLRNISIVLIILSACTAIVWAGNEGAEKVKIGDAVPDFTVVTANGKLTAADLKGKVVLINFFATWCPPCRTELPVLEKQVWEKYNDNDDFVLLVIGREHTREELVRFAAEKELDLPFYPDVKREIFSQFASQSIPRNYIVDRAGQVVYASAGFSDKEFKHLLDVLKKQL